MSKKKKGFTLIELSLAIAFVSILLIIVALVTDDVISTYRKGVAMKSINTIGLNLIDEFTNTISQSPSTNLENLCSRYRTAEAAADGYIAYNKCIEDRGAKFMYQAYKKKVKVMDKNRVLENEVPTYGVFCTGRYSYIWNTGYALNDALYKLEDGTTSVPKAELEVGGSPRISDFRLYKVSDMSRALCINHVDDNYATLADNTFTIGEAGIPEELLTYGSEKSGLALYDFSVFPPAHDTATNHLYYSFSMILGTISSSVDITADTDRCLTPDDFRSDYNYCAINKINFAVRATGGV